MYQKILVPVERSIRETEGVLDMAKNLLAPDGGGILLHIIPPGSTITVGLYMIPAYQVEKDQRTNAMNFLGYFAEQLNQSLGRWRCEVAVSKSVAEGIVDFAVREEVDLIAMFTHDRKGLAKLIKGSIAEKVQQGSPIEVRVLKPRELVPQ